MDVKEAIAVAKAYVQDIYAAAETISDLSLEEVQFDPANDQWLITVEFGRPVSNTLRTRIREVLEATGADVPVPRRRVQKVVAVSDATREAVGMRNREAA